jgi:hypothetical protein
MCKYTTEKLESQVIYITIQKSFKNMRILSCGVSEVIHPYGVIKRYQYYVIFDYRVRVIFEYRLAMLLIKEMVNGK